jgi:hypothetical protein
MPADQGLRLDNRKGIENAWRNPIEADEDQTVKVT